MTRWRGYIRQWGRWTYKVPQSF